MLAAANPGSLQMTRLLWTDQSNVPSSVHMLVAVPGRDVEQGVFRNEPAPRPADRSPNTDRLRAGVAFHRLVQTEFIAGLVAADARPERTIRLLDGRNGRVDLLVAPSGHERMGVVIGVKNTNWDVLPTHRIRPNVHSHLRQIQCYLDEVLTHLGEPDGWDSAVGVLLYPKQPSALTVTDTITSIIERRGLTVVWHDETDWGGATVPTKAET
jgi:hypothetical protein